MILRNLVVISQRIEEDDQGMFVFSFSGRLYIDLHALLYEPARWASNSIQFGPIAA